VGGNTRKSVLASFEQATEETTKGEADVKEESPREAACITWIQTTGGPTLVVENEKTVLTERVRKRLGERDNSSIRRGVTQP